MLNFEEYDYLDTQTSVKIITDSYSSISQQRATTMLWRVPEIILPQLNTYRVWSRNVASNRAKRFSATSKNMTYTPAIWMENHKGMVSTNLVPKWKAVVADIIWKSAGNFAYLHGWMLDKLNISKQYSNRTTTPYRFTDYLVTATSWENFLIQRDDFHAQFEIQVLARRVKTALKESVPTELKLHEWHLPFVGEDLQLLPIYDKVRISAARCARTSYGKNEGKDIDADLQLYNKLVHSKPPHLSPVEHQLLANNVTRSGNIDGFTQYRKMLELSNFNEKYIKEIMVL